MNFKLLAIRPLDGCSDDVLNILKADTTYYFDDSYRYDDIAKYLVKRTDVSDLPNDFFYKIEKDENKDEDKYKSSLTYVNIQAIVGKNGSGKSSLIELMLRILNNFFKQYRLSEATDNLVYSKGVKAELYYLKNDIIYKFFVDTTRLNDYEIKKDELFKEPKIDIKFYDSPNCDSTSLEKHLAEKSGIRDENFIELKNLFFSMYINYSLYGLDSGNYIDETILTNISLKDNLDNLDDISWLDGIIHKNDSYQTPVVIHPYREEAQINIRNEKELLKQRLVSLIITEKDYIQLSEKIFFKRLKLESVKQDIIKNNVVGVLNRLYNKYKVNNYDNNIFFIKNNIVDSEQEKLKNEKKKINLFYKNYTKINTRFNLNENIILINEDYELYSQFLLYFVSYQEIIDEDFSKEEIRKKVQEKIKERFDIENQDKLDFLFNFFIKISLPQLGKILVIDVFYDFWLKELNINEPFIDEFEKALFEYIVVKSYKTIRYPKYRNYDNLDVLLGFIPNDFQLSDNVSDSYYRFLQQLIKDTSHVSIKLHQAITMLTIKEQVVYKLYRALYADGKNTKEFDTLDIETLRNAIVKTIKKTKIEPIYLIPPPIFNLDIQVSSDNSEAVHSIKKLSSGEFQLISMISSIIYHLKNLDSVKEEKYQGKNYTEQIFQYRNVNIILDEIELYFHPEFQRDFIYEIIERLKNITFKSIEAISFLFITHSPFILSDIPSQNVLKLKDGKIETDHDKINSFGSNIHDLLADEFFLEYQTIGKLAKRKIDNLIKFLSLKYKIQSLEKEKTNIILEVQIFYNNLIALQVHEFEKELKNIEHFSREDADTLIEIIGEPLIKNKLREMFNSIYKLN